MYECNAQLIQIDLGRIDPFPMINLVFVMEGYP
jgi:hypothetical protein